jgi:G3E family GTPase
MQQVQTRWSVASTTDTVDHRTSTPVLIVTGFLGSGKTTLINRAISGANSHRIGLLVNEFGDIGIDGAMIDAAPDNIIELTNGCLCCESRGDLDAALVTLSARAGQLDAIVVETSGLADPTRAVESVLDGRFPAPLTLSGVITTVDCANFDANLRLATLAYRQMVAADLFVLTKTELTSADDLQQIPGRLARINALAAVVTDAEGADALQTLLHSAVPSDRPRREATGRPDHPTLPAVTVTLPQPVDRARFLDWAESLTSSVVRVKGLIRFGDAPDTYVVDRVGARTTSRLAPLRAAARLGSRGALLVMFGRSLEGAVESLERLCQQ